MENCTPDQPILPDGVLFQETNTGQVCPKCGNRTMTIDYSILNGGSCDTSVWDKSCPCGYNQRETPPNTSDYAY